MKAVEKACDAREPELAGILLEILAALESGRTELAARLVAALPADARRLVGGAGSDES